MYTPFSRAKPKPSVPITAPECRMPRLPILQRAWKVTLANRCVPSPISASRPTKQPASMTAPAWTTAPASTVTFGPICAPGRPRALVHHGARVHAGRRHDFFERGEILRGAGEVGVGVGGDDARAFIGRGDGGVVQRATISAAARLCAASARSLLLLRKLMCEASALSSGAMPWTSRSGSPSSCPPKRSTKSPSRVPIWSFRVKGKTE
jgi:hypothetical protein